MLMSNGGLNLIYQWPIQKRSENGSKPIPRVRRSQTQKRPRFSIKRHKFRQPLQAHNRSSQSKEIFNRSFTCFRKMKSPHLKKKVMKKAKIVNLRKTISMFV
ncbi:uncharacterized protein DS421_12g366130 [Arachis hypogaea]|nr:uncharacterized protein DS421_12g366130 [Arachis hypogaea]